MLPFHNLCRNAFPQYLQKKAAYGWQHTAPFAQILPCDLLQSTTVHHSPLQDSFPLLEMVYFVLNYEKESWSKDKTG